MCKYKTEYLSAHNLNRYYEYIQQELPLYTIHLITGIILIIIILISYDTQHDAMNNFTLLINYALNLLQFMFIVLNTKILLFFKKNHKTIS